MEDIDCVTGKERKMGPRDKHTMTQIMEREKKKRRKTNASVAGVESMDNVSPLWC